MCNRRRRTVVVAFAILAVLAERPLRAQDTDAYRSVVERLAGRVEALTLLESPARQNPEIGPLDTLTYGTISLLVPPPRRAFADEVGRAVWDTIVAYFGPDTSAVAPTVVALVPAGRRVPLAATFQIPLRPEHPVDYAIGFVLNQVREREVARIDHGRWGEWFSQAAKAMLFWPSDLRLQAAYFDLATKPWSGVRDCFAGDLGQCARVASVGPDDPVTGHFTVEERRRIVERARRDVLPLRRSAAAARCVDDGIDSACVELFQQHPAWIREDPLSPMTRATLIHTALDLGGEGAFGRLVASEGEDVLARLATAAGVSQDTLLATWQRRILAERPQSTTLPRLPGWLAFLWAVVFTVAATRSTRWHRG
jgi:hypothetical protein